MSFSDSSQISYNIENHPNISSLETKDANHDIGEESSSDLDDQTSMSNLLRISPEPSSLSAKTTASHKVFLTAVSKAIEVLTESKNALSLSCENNNSNDEIVDHTNFFGLLKELENVSYRIKKCKQFKFWSIL